MNSQNEPEDIVDILANKTTGHAFDRISPMGGEFIGRCKKCGKESVVNGAALNEVCPANTTSPAAIRSN